MSSAAPPTLFAEGWSPVEVGEEVSVARLVRQHSLELIEPLPVQSERTVTQVCSSVCLSVFVRLSVHVCSSLKTRIGRRDSRALC